MKRYVTSTYLISLSTLLVGCYKTEQLHQEPATQIYVQASKGSFNDAAILKLLENRPSFKPNITFSGTPSNAYALASNHPKSLAFTAVENSTIDGKLVQETIDAIQNYKIKEVKGFITIPIEMCALMNINDVEKRIPISLIASHPAALKQINNWKSKIKAQELSIPEGTAKSAEKVSKKELPSGTVAVGACVLSTIYPNLKIVEKNIQDNSSNKTSFLLVKVEKRNIPITKSEARNELILAIEKGTNF